MAESAPETESLSRSITLPRLVLYGVGTILGAGIFVVIGEVIGESGTLAPLAYLAAGAVAFLTALSYAEISARVPTAGGPTDYVERAFRHRRLGSMTGWLLMTANTVSAATITSGFVGYLSIFVDVPGWLVALLVATGIGAIGAAGMRSSTWFMTVTTGIGIVTLLAVIWATREGLTAIPSRLGGELSGANPAMLTGLFSGAFLAIYSFIGFGDMALTAEEVKQVERTLPRAILIALAIVFLFYLLVSIAVVGAGPVEEIASARAPLVAAVEREGWPAWPVGLASLFVIVNGALTQIIGASRLLMDIGRDARGAPGFFGRVNPVSRTPLIATATLTAIVALLAAFVDLQHLAEATSLISLAVFFLVNCALIGLKRRSQPDEVPDIWIGIPLLGALSTLGAILAQIAFWFS